MKIIIVGGGPGGLSTYLALQKHVSPDTPLSIKIYESRSSAAATDLFAGGGLALATNGRRALSLSSPSAASHLCATAFHGDALTFRNARGTLLGHLNIGRGRDDVYDLLLPRAAVHAALLDEVRKEDIVWGMQVKRVTETKDGVDVEFVDGSVESADLVIGADGVRSVVREAVVGEGYGQEYQGFAGFGSFVPISALPPSLQHSLAQNPLTITFGPNGMFGYAPCSRLDGPEPRIMWWSVFEAPNAPPRDVSLAAVRTQLMERHESWTSPYDAPDARVFRSMIESGCGKDDDAEPDITTASAKDEGLLIIPRYVTPRLPRWSTPSGKVILIGDAAHTVPSDSGQGASCAIEDGVALALLLKHGLSGSEQEEALRKAAQAYQEVRMPRIWAILDESQRRGNAKKDKTWLGERVRDCILWILCRIPESWMDNLYDYDVEAEVGRYIGSST